MEVRRDGPVVHAELVNPRRRNALTWAMYDQLSALCDTVAGDTDVRLVVIRGAGDAFAAGTDVHQFTDFADGADGLAYERRVARVLDRLLGLRVPLLGVVDGPAVGAGLAIAAVCDILVATPRARFGVPIARTLGNCIPAAVLARLQQRLGAGRTMAALLTARLIDADDAAAAGLVYAVWPAEELEAGVADLVRAVCAGAPLTLAALKEIDRRLAAATMAVEDADVLERCYGSADFREGVRAFTERRRPRWRQIMMVDAHHHFWTANPHVPVEGDFGPGDLAPGLAATGVDTTILVQAVNEPAENDRLAAHADEVCFVAGVVGWLPVADPAAARREHARARTPLWSGFRCLVGRDPIRPVRRARAARPVP